MNSSLQKQYHQQANELFRLSYVKYTTLGGYGNAI